MLSDQPYLRDKQYKNASNLEARIALHQRFSINAYGWLPWVFDQFDFPGQARVLELGCGPGSLWRTNSARIPTGWNVTLSDFSSGMLAEAQHNLAGVHPFTFQQVDAQAISFNDGSFGAVIANHMLYHVPDRAKAYAEIRRVVRPGGRLYAATNGINHMRELEELELRFDSSSSRWSSAMLDNFRLETSGAELAEWFDPVELRRYHDGLVVTEAEPLVAYILSEGVWLDTDPAREAALRTFVTRELVAHDGTIHITKDAGLFVATRAPS